jgi:hypothetical protein
MAFGEKGREDSGKEFSGQADVSRALDSDLEGATRSFFSLARFEIVLRVELHSDAAMFMSKGAKIIWPATITWQ